MTILRGHQTFCCQSVSDADSQEVPLLQSRGYASDTHHCVYVCAATLCSVSMLRVDWPKEAKKAQEESLAIQQAHQHSVDGHMGSDLEQAMNGDANAANASAAGEHSLI